MIWIILGVILCTASMLYGAVLASTGEVFRPAAFVVLGLSFLWFMWEIAHFE